MTAIEGNRGEKVARRVIPLDGDISVDMRLRSMRRL